MQKTITTLIIFLLAFTLSLNATGMPKEYYNLKSNVKSKKYFFDYLFERIEKENISILQEREFVLNLLNSNVLNIDFNSPSFLKLIKIKKKYRIKNLYSINEYMKKVDIVPPSMALAQAAVESGWGRSRFIKEANNIFGHWTYNPKIGMKPKDRDENAKHYIRIFKNLQASIKAYMLNLNRNRAYKEFQNKRFEQRQINKLPEGLELSQTMLKYSGIGHDYLGILKNVITKNKLQDYDKKFYKNLNKRTN